ncbi:MAG TPA: TIGR02266 family protein [Polyangiaceae bacterium]|jgi:uncharacterized protein (TIGR02266 family)|nr:TIGR02266 family protein [Polyangiaceae bacterium]
MKQAKKSTPRAATPEAESVSQRIETPASESVRREHKRVSVELEVSLGSEHNFYAGLAENLSAGGVFIATHRLQKVGSKIDVSLRMPDSAETFELVGEVRWVRVYNEQSDTPPGLGIRFEALPPEATAAIERFLAQREPLFFDDD